MSPHSERSQRGTADSPVHHVAGTLLGSSRFADYSHYYRKDYANYYASSETKG